jgi:hypothetical protein
MRLFPQPSGLLLPGQLGPRNNFGYRLLNDFLSRVDPIDQNPIYISGML